MGNLKNREKFGTTLPIWQTDEIRKLSEQTRIPISRLTEEAYNDLLIKYGIEKPKEPNND